MQEPWEQAHTDASVSFSSFRRDGSLLLSGALAGLAASIVAAACHAACGVALGLGPLAFLRDIAGLTLGGSPAPSGGVGPLAAALGLFLVAGTGLGVVFSLAADRLAHRDSILWLAIGWGVGLGAIMLAALEVEHVGLRMPAGEVFLVDLVFGLSLVVQQAAMDILESRGRPQRISHEGEGPVRLPVLGRA